MIVEQTLIVNLDNQPIRFTPDGKVSVVDAIKMVTGPDNPWSIWENLTAEHPDLLTHCKEHASQNEGVVPVVGSEGWEKIWMVLLDYLPELG
jgi:hypothetical protein